MFVPSEAIIGLWLLPVVLNIFIPLAMLGSWIFLQMFKKRARRAQQVEQPA
jgi:hypothetical protein